ncbi:hypothetical protein BH09SUM1_BH09SUM1_21200 [soil metagenome]
MSMINPAPHGSIACSRSMLKSTNSSVEVLLDLDDMALKLFKFIQKSRGKIPERNEMSLRNN